MRDIFVVSIICGTLVVLTFMILLSLPKSRLRCVVLEIVSWAGVALAALLVVSPIDLVPDFVPVAGWADDVGYLTAGVAAAVTAVRSRRERRELAEKEDL